MPFKRILPDLASTQALLAPDVDSGWEALVVRPEARGTERLGLERFTRETLKTHGELHSRRTQVDRYLSGEEACNQKTKRNP